MDRQFLSTIIIFLGMNSFILGPIVQEIFKEQIAVTGKMIKKTSRKILQKIPKYIKKK
jgi:hypothetical protein